jgi:putative transposase
MRSDKRSGRERLERSSALREAAVCRVLGELVERRHRGQLRAVDVRAAAITAGVSERTLWRWLAAGRPPAPRPASPTRRDLTPELRDAYLRLGGNAAAVWREARERSAEPPALRTLQAASARELSPAERAAARSGEPGRRAHALYLRYEAPHRNAVWQADHKQLPLLVVPPGGRRGRRRG